MGDAEFQSQAEEFVEKVRGFFAPRIIGAVAVMQEGMTKVNFEMVSGCLVLVRDRLVWLTAGHFIEQILAWHTDGCLNGVFLVYVIKDSIATYAPIDFNENLVFAAADADIMDAGFVILGNNLANALVKAEAKAIPAERFGCAPAEGLIATQLIGYSAEHSVIGDAIIHEYESAGRRYGIHKTEVKAISRRHVLLHPLERDQQNPLRCVARPVFKTERSVAGMSGGVVVAFEPGKAIRDFRLLGIQSSERNTTRRGETAMTRIECYDAGAILAAVDAKVASMLGAA